MNKYISIAAAAVLFLLGKCLITINQFRSGASAKVNKKPGEKVSISVMMGSGGHSAELLKMIDALMFKVYTPRLWLIHSGDTLTTNRVVELENFKQTAATLDWTDSGYYAIKYLHRLRGVGEGYSKLPGNLFVSFIQCLSLSILPPPDISNPSSTRSNSITDAPSPHLGDMLIMNGPSTCVSLVAAIWVAKLVGIPHPKMIYIESFTRVDGISTTGKLVKPNNLNKPTPAVPVSEKKEKKQEKQEKQENLPDKILFSDIHNQVKTDTKSNRVQPVEPVPRSRSPFRLTSLVKRFTLFFLLYTFLAHLFCHTPITPDSSDLCVRHQSTVEYFEPVYYDHVHPVILPHLQQAQNKLNPITTQLVKLEPYLSRSKKSATHLYNASIHPRLEIQSRRLANRFKPVYDEWQGVAMRYWKVYHDKYYLPISTHKHTQRVFSLLNQSQKQIQNTYTALHPHLSVVHAYSQRQAIRALSTTWSYTKTYYPHIRTFLTKYLKRAVAEWLAISHRITSHISRLALGQYVKFGLDDKLITVKHFHSLKGKFLDPVLSRLAEWIEVQRSNTASTYGATGETADEISYFLASMSGSEGENEGEKQGEGEGEQVKENSGTGTAVPEAPQPTPHLEETLTTLNDTHTELSRLLDASAVQFMHRLSTQRAELASSVTLSSEKAVESLTSDFQRLMDGFVDYHEREMSEISDQGDEKHHTHTQNIETVRTKVTNKLRQLAQNVLDGMVRWQGEIDEMEVKMIGEAISAPREFLTRAQREVGSTLAWTDGVTYRDWMHYHHLTQTFDERVDHLSDVQETDLVLEPLFEEVFGKVVALEQQFESRVASVGKVYVSEQEEEEEERIEEQEDAQEKPYDHYHQEPHTPFENDDNSQDVEQSTEKEFIQHSPLVDTHKDNDTAHGTIFDVADYPTSTAIPESAAGTQHVHEEL
ncbi:hypothetical protein E3P92_02639 [Wallemia ichthyophaga]|nr:hypothetical protein E3P92_02639 [Wallemia ichthyophaga]